MLSEFLDFNVFGFFLVFARVGTAFMVMPGFSASYVNARVRLGIGLSVSFVSAQLLFPLLPDKPPGAADMLILIASETYIGLFFGILGRVALGTLQIAGTYVSMFSSLANALVRDPIAEQQSSVVSNLMTTIGLLLIFVTDMHHVMFEALLETYALFKPGDAIVVGDIAMMLARGVAASVALALQLASPFLVLALSYYAGLGILGRLMPALPLFFFAMPVQISLQFLTMIITLSGIMMLFLQHFQETFLPFVGS
jgi:flagellar biosynthesis protein FliR